MAEKASPETFARLALETYRCWKVGDLWHYHMMREKAIEQGELLRVERIPFRETSVEQRQRIMVEKRTERTV